MTKREAPKNADARKDKRVDAVDTTSVERDRGLPPDVPEDEAVVQSNAASGGWQGVSEVIQNDFEQEQLEEATEGPRDGDADAREGDG